MTRRRLGTFAAAIMIATFDAGAAETSVYQWTCKAQGYFGLRVSPGGMIAPIADTSLTEPISIVIRRRKEAKVEPQDRDMIYPFNDEYVVGFEGKDTGPFQQTPNDDLETSGARFSSGKEGLYEARAIYFNYRTPSLLTLKRADKDWVFFVYSGGLTTDAEARRMNITLPTRPSGPSQPEANTYFMTGRCIQKQ